MSARDELLRACATGDEVTLGRHGWRPVFDALAGWWPKRFGATDLRPYVTLLADERPEAIVAALELLTTMRGGGFRPSPAELRALVHADDDGERRDVGDCGSPSQSPEVLARVAAEVLDGAQLCDCGGPTSRTWVIDPPPRRREPPRGVWRCRDCGGLEPGQVYAAEDAGLIARAA
jgi:hypothetical protein